MYPKERILREFLRNDSGALSKNYIDILRNFYGEDLARLSFIHSIERLVNTGQLFKQEDCLAEGYRPYAVLNTVGNRSLCESMFYTTGPYIVHQRSPIIAMIAGANSLFVESGNAKKENLPSMATPVAYNAGRLGSALDLFLSAAPSEEERSALQNAAQNIHKAYISKVYDRLSVQEYTNLDLLISSVDEDALFARDNWRAWIS
jgi:hypothetical protein